MGSPTAPPRCEKHGLVRGPDGLCVLCRRNLAPATPPAPAPASTPASRSDRVLSWPPVVKLPGLASAIDAFKRVLPLRSPRPEPNPTIATEPPKSAPPRSSPRSSPRPPRSSPRPPHSTPTSLRAAMGLIENPVQGFELVFYALSTCSVCRAAREYLLHHGIPFRERDVERDSAAAADALRLNPRRSVPTFDLGGREVLIGFTPHELEAALARVRALPARRPPNSV
jgi:glutaredoxin